MIYVILLTTDGKGDVVRPVLRYIRDGAEFNRYCAEVL